MSQMRNQKTNVRLYNDHVFEEPEVPVEIEELLDRSSVVRCSRCKCILFIGTIAPGSVIEIECRRCRLKNVRVVMYGDKK